MGIPFPGKKEVAHGYVPGLDHGPLHVPPTQPGHVSLHQSDKKGTLPGTVRKDIENHLLVLPGTQQQY